MNKYADGFKFTLAEAKEKIPPILERWEIARGAIAEATGEQPEPEIMVTFTMETETVPPKALDGVGIFLKVIQ